jgi:hypothetical protein
MIGNARTGEPKLENSREVVCLTQAKLDAEAAMRMAKLSGERPAIHTSGESDRS